MKNLKQLAARGYTRAVVGTGLLASSMIASAQTSSTGIDSILDAVDLSGISTKVIAMGLLIVGIALVFKGPDLAKRVIRKV